ncbi:MAG: GDP-L-fucose synthase [Desulfobacter sp.]|nr:MAG: GDP-L-fucose synthase [Desulfobacter sp.]
MNKTDKILIAGASGMVGSAIIRNLVKKGYTNLIGTYHSSILDEQKDMPINHIQADLTRQAEVDSLFKTETPAYVFLAAARVGGIHANNTYPAQFIYENLAIQTNVIHAAYVHKAARLLFLGSSCVYPKDAPQPIKEEYLLTGPLEPTNEPYAIAKIAGIKMCEAYNRQYGTRFMAIMPTNLYGPNDNFDLETSHVLPALIRKFHEAKMAGAPEVVVWGTGNPRREFLHVDDMADASTYIISMTEDDWGMALIVNQTLCFFNVGTGIDCTIKELAQMIKNQIGYEGRLVWDEGKPDGTFRKILDISILKSLGWEYCTPLKKGIKLTYDWFRSNNH